MKMPDLAFVKKYVYLNDVDSTNTYAKSIGDFPKDGLTVVRALKQSGGRGRSGNRYFSDHEGGLWVSTVTPVADISTHFKYNRAISLAILESLKAVDTSAEIFIKWPNDVYYNNRKIAGILLENIASDPDMIITGFGVNVNIATEEFPEDLRETATSVQIETGVLQPLDSLLEDILSRYDRYRNLDDGSAHELYSKYLYKKGSPASVGESAGTFVGVDLDGRLRLETGCGHLLFSSGTLRYE